MSAEHAQQRIVAVHQPNFLPWLGFFDKLARADVFVLLDSVQFPRSSTGSWTNRVRLMVGGQPSWVTIPVRRSEAGLQRIDAVRIDENQRWRDKLRKTVQANYARTPGYQEVFPVVEEILDGPRDALAEMNIHGVRILAERLGIQDTELVRSSELSAEGSATELLIALVKAVNGTSYLGGDGAAGYQDDAAFARAGVELLQQRFVHPVYDQGHDFAAGLSVIDAAMHLGWRGAAALLA